MTLHATSRLANFKDSIKKYFLESLETAEGVQVTFDKNVENIPKVQGTPVDRWVAVLFGPMDVSNHMASGSISVYCCTQRDSEGFKLAQLRDTVYGYLTDPDATDCMRRITLYRSYRDIPWENIGGMIIQEILEGAPGDLTNEIKFLSLNVRFRWGARI